MVRLETIDSIVEEFNNFKKSYPWDGDQVDAVCDLLKILLNFHQGNIRENEKEQQLAEWYSLNKRF